MRRTHFNKIKKVMEEFEHGKLKSHGRKVTKRDQAVAIALSEQREYNKKHGYKTYIVQRM